MPEIYHWFNPTNSRYYTITVQRDMLNDKVLTYSWGGRQSKIGGSKSLLVETEEEIQNHITYMMKRRKSRGYHLEIQE
jgi:predicted DNA-binding WGR domain protein